MKRKSDPCIKEATMTAKEIIYQVCDYFHVDENFINTTKRDEEIIKVKHIAVYFIKKYTDLTHKGAGRYFVGRNSYYDHASVIHAVNAVNNRYDTDPIYRKQVDEIDMLISGKIASEIYYEHSEIYMENDFYKN